MNRPDEEFDDFLARRKPIFSRASENPLEPPDELDRLVLRQAREAIASENPHRVFKGPGWAVPMALAATVLLAVTVVLRVEMPTNASPDEVAVRTVAQRLDAAPAAPAAPAAVPDNMARAGGAPAQAQAQSTNAVVADERAEPPRTQHKLAGSPQSRDRRAIVADTADGAAGAPERSSTGGFVSEAEADRYVAPPAGGSAARNAAPTAGVVVEDSVTGSRTVVTTIAPPPTEAERALAKATSGPAFRRDAKSWLAEIDRLRAEGKSAQADAEFAEYKRQYRAYAVSPDR
jgi:hypothetical protein